MTKENEQPVIYFQAYKIEKFSYIKKDNSKNTDSDEKKEEPFRISVSPGYDETNSRAVIEVHVIFNNDDISVDIAVNGYFDLVDGKTENFEKYLVINGTAILFPYIRSMVSMLTSLDNEHAILLPTINTKNLWNNKDK
ncbi:hypothetical protein C122C_0832 [Leuconostoc gelidum subsp. gasicomitatum]|uniref:Preprotein translocase subunit SecB n=1 Tax=Leuconostoc gasicomitatum TaxID=115778 RepID=A0ABM9V581_9LACO|nr:protein-export chaperone SecB [Leuconostoc gasicomitatum]CUW10662.1 hypothetical protein C122C_0832 [Leuconostoc gasicomitatum]